jgi:glycosyltransferase involved in cell wall biosynthesis
MDKNIIFHIPWELKNRQFSATAIRPRKMMHAFLQLGYRADIVWGDAVERKARIEEIKHKIALGKRYQFVYSESSTAPTPFANGIKDSLKGFDQDIRFLKFLHGKGIPIGLYYRDMYWMFPKADPEESFLRKMIFKPFYFRDLECYRRFVDIFFVQTEEMSRLLPRKGHDCVDLLPPGLEHPQHPVIDKDHKLTLFYSGGLNKAYDMDLVLETLSSRKEVQNYMCFRKHEWEMKKRYFRKADLGGIKVLHASADELPYYMNKSHIGLCYFKPEKARQYMLPVKIFHYMEYNLPILATEGTPTGDFVKNNNIGWSIPYNKQVFEGFIDSLLANPEQIEEKIRNLAEIKRNHTWIERAKYTALKLSEKRLPLNEIIEFPVTFDHTADPVLLQ